MKRLFALPFIALFSLSALAYNPSISEQEEIRSLIQAGELRAVETKLKNGLNPNFKFTNLNNTNMMVLAAGYLYSPLSEAQVSVFARMMDYYGGDVSYVESRPNSRYKISAASIAAKKGSKAVLETLHGLGVDLSNQISHRGGLSLYLSALSIDDSSNDFSDTEALNFILSTGEVDPTENGTYQSYQAANDNYYVVKTLTNNGLDLRKTVRDLGLCDQYTSQKDCEDMQNVESDWYER